MKIELAQGATLKTKEGFRGEAYEFGNRWAEFLRSHVHADSSLINDVKRMSGAVAAIDKAAKVLIDCLPEHSFWRIRLNVLWLATQCAPTSGHALMYGKVCEYAVEVCAFLASDSCELWAYRSDLGIGWSGWQKVRS